MRPHPRATLFPYTTLFRSHVGDEVRDIVSLCKFLLDSFDGDGDQDVEQLITSCDEALQCDDVGEDRKSTRLNSSHTVISYAVFCLKKKKKQKDRQNKRNTA